MQVLDFSRPAKVWAKVGDISLAGCYLQIGKPLEVGRRLTLLMRIGTTELEVTGVVRVRYPGIAMGIEFTFMSKADQHALTRLIAQLEEFDMVAC